MPGPLSGTAGEVAALILWLLSDDAACICGTTQLIDGALKPGGAVAAAGLPGPVRESVYLGTL